MTDGYQEGLKEMKVLHLNTSDLKGGASRAAYRLHQGLLKIGVNSQMLVQNKISDCCTVISAQSKFEKGWIKLKPTLDAIPLQCYRRRNCTPYSTQWLPDRIASKIAKISPDIINLHWINAGYLQIETIAKFNKPVVWTLHDMWAFTGGCHYNQGCDRYTNSCGACPQLQSNRDWDLSRWVWQRKAKAWRELNLTLVSPSRWLAQCASSSSLFRDFRVEVIHHSLDTTIYKPIDRKMARDVLNLPQEKLLILFGAFNATRDPRKGFHLLQAALQHLNQSGWRDQLGIVIFGSSEPIYPDYLGFKCHYLGRLNDDFSLVLSYSASDVMVVPSTQESFGQTAFESLACATPVVAFNTTGLKDIVEHQLNGYLAQPFDIQDFARGISWILEDGERYARLSDRARQKVEQEFTTELQAKRYHTLFSEII